MMHPDRWYSVLKDDRTPLFAKILPIAALAYLLLPIDLLPDFIPFLGQMDDLTIAFALIYFALELIPPEVFADAGIARPGNRKIDGKTE